MALLARMARAIGHVACCKIETARAASRLREPLARGGDAIEGPWDGKEAIRLLAGRDAGRHPFPALHPAVRAGLLGAARRLDPRLLRCAC